MSATRRRRRSGGSALISYSPEGPAPTGLIFSRSTAARFFDQNGIEQVAGVDVLRDNHYIGGVRTALREPTRVNSILWSRDLTNAAWAVVGGTLTRALNVVGLDGTANSATTLTDTDAANISSVSQSVTVPVDSNTHVLSFYVKKDSDTARFPMLFGQISGGTTVRLGVYLNTQTGATAVGLSLGTVSSRVVDIGLWWVVEIALTNNSTALNTSLMSQIFPARSTVIGVDNVAATGSCVIGHTQIELNASYYSSPILTTTGSTSRAFDNLRSTVAFNPQSLTAYIKYIDLGTIKEASNPRIWEIGNNTNMSFLVFQNTGASLAVATADAAGSHIGGGASTPMPGDLVEARAFFDSSLIANLGVSMNSGVESVGTPSAAPGAGAPFSPAQLSYGANNGANGSLIAIRRLVILPGLHTLDEMRAA